MIIERSLMRLSNLLVAAPLGVLLVACAEAPPEVPPEQLSENSFHYPEELWDAGVEGETILEILVSEEGAVDSVFVEESSGYAAFDSSAVEGARMLRFEPARRGDDSVSVRVLLPVQFHLPTTEAAADTTTPAAADTTSQP